MCLILLAWRAHPVYALVAAANRDEFYRRRSAPLSVWPTEPAVYAGRDLAAGGTWLGVTRAGRFAAVTNIREPGRSVARARSRGELVTNFLVSQDSPQVHLADVPRKAYNGFNLLAADRDELWWYSNRDGDPQRVEPGLHGVSNALLDTPWPKVTGGVAELARVLDADDGTTEPDAYLAILADRQRAADRDLPKTGVPHRFERALSARFVTMPGYGTRVSTVLRIRHDGSFVDITERTFGRRRTGTVTLTASY